MSPHSGKSLTLSPYCTGLYPLEKHLAQIRKIPVIRSLKRLARVLGWILASAAALVTVAFLLFNFRVLPRLDYYRADLQTRLSAALGRQVTVGRLSGSWDGLAPRFDITRLSIANPGGAPLTLERVTVVPSWSSLIHFEPRMALIRLSGPVIDMIRTRDGRLTVNGFPLSTPGGNGEAGNWLLRQRAISVVDASISWEDRFLGLSRVTLGQGRLDLASGLLGHTLKISGRPPAAVGERLEIAASWRGDDLRDWQHWSGDVSARLNGARVDAVSRYLQAFGLLRAGEGDGSMEASFADGRINSLTADVKVKNAAYTATSPGASEMALPMLSGHLSVKRSGNTYQIGATHLTIQSASGPIFQEANINGTWSATGGGFLRVDNVNLSYLEPMLHAVGIDRNPLFARFSPRGELKNVALSWQGRIEAPTRYGIEASFDHLAWQPFGAIPGVAGVSGSVRFDQNGGRLRLDHAEQIRMPRVFPKPLAFTALDADMVWRTGSAGLSLDFNRFRFANADLSGWLSGNYRRSAAGGAGTIDLKAGIGRVAATRVPDYMPYQAGHDTLRWLAMALKGGELDNAALQLSGNLDRFPFRGGHGGLFLVTGQVRGGRLLFEPEWPTIDGIDATLQFRNERMDIASSHASTFGVPLSTVKVAIPDLGADTPLLQIQGKAAGPLDSMLRYTVKSPVDRWLSGFTGKTRARGAATLDLGLEIPLSAPQKTRVNGLVRFAGNRLEMTSLPLPPLEGVSGQLGFNEHGVSSPGVRFGALGGSAVLKASTDNAGNMRFTVDGRFDSGKVFARFVPPLASQVSGSSSYQARFSIRNGLQSLLVDTDLVGTRIDLPPPLEKPAAEILRHHLTLTPANRGAGGYRIDFTVGGDGAGRGRIDSRGTLQSLVLAIGRPLGAQQPPGLSIKAALPSIDLQRWAAWGQTQGERGTSHDAGMPFHLEMATPQLRWGSLTLTAANVWLGHLPGDARWHAMIDANEIKGEIDYDPTGNGTVRARLPLVVFDPRSYRSLGGSELSKLKISSLPALDVRVARLMWRSTLLGSVNLNARYNASDWLLDNINLKMPEGTFNGSMQVLGAGRVDSRFSIASTDVGKLLERMGVKDSFRKGQGRFSGELSWPGGLESFDPAHLSGHVSGEVTDGRFARINPGVARLLGVISLQSLPRRIQLDFTDVFSEGFSFDTLNGDASINQGIFRSDNIRMKGPAADVQINGEVSLPEESQKLMVHVEPHMSESVALATGAALINPVVGVAALAAQKILQDPVSKIFSVDYRITGSLNNPVVTKVSAPVVHNPIRKVRP